MIEYKSTDAFCEYKHMHFADIIDIYFNDVWVGCKYVDKAFSTPKIWYLLDCDLDFIEECEQKFGYGWMLEDRGFVIYPEDGTFSLEQIEQNLIPKVSLFILNHAIEYLDKEIDEVKKKFEDANHELVEAYACHLPNTPYTKCDEVLEKGTQIEHQLNELWKRREELVDAITKQESTV